MARKRKEVEPSDTLAEELEGTDDAPEAQSESPEEAEADSVESVVVTKWLVLKSTKVSLYGQITTLPAGSTISVGSYGEDGIRRIMAQGVHLEPVI